MTTFAVLIPFAMDVDMDLYTAALQAQMVCIYAMAATLLAFGAIAIKRYASRRLLTAALAVLVAVSLARVVYAATVPNDPYCDWYGAWLFNWFYCH